MHIQIWATSLYNVVFACDSGVAAGKSMFNNFIPTAGTLRHTSHIDCIVIMQVTHKHSGGHRGSADTDTLVPAWRAASSPTPAATRQRPLSFHCPEDTDMSWCQHYRADAAVHAYGQLSPRRLPQHRHRFDQHCSSMDTLCKDMRQLDAQIADLDLNLASASQKLHH